MLDRRITVFLIDDHELIRQGLRGMLEQQGDMRVVGDCRTAHEALSMVAVCCPDIVLVDVEAPAGGIELVRHLRRKDSGATVDVIALADTAASLPEAMAAGAAGYLLKDIGSKELAQAVREVYSGERNRDGAPSDEAIDLVVTMPAKSASILRFATLVEKYLRANIVQTVGSWDQGTVITILLEQRPFDMLLPQLATLPGVLRAEEEAPGETTVASIIKRVKGLRPCRRRILVTLDNHPMPQPARRPRPAAA